MVDTMPGRVENVDTLDQPAQSGFVHEVSEDERDEIMAIVTAASVFDDTEIATVEELLDEYFDDPDESGYHCLSYRDGLRSLGFALWGSRDLSEKGYDLFWLATHPDAQRQGVARTLLSEVEANIHERGGYWLLIETSTSAQYSAARRFYESCGYQPAVDLPDFYRDGEGLVIYTKRVG